MTRIVRRRLQAVLIGTIADVSTASSTAFFSVPVETGEIKAATLTLVGAITAANAVVQLTLNGTNITGATCTVVQAGSAAGSTFLFTIPDGVKVKRGDYLSAVSNGGSTTARAAQVSVLLDVE